MSFDLASQSTSSYSIQYDQQSHKTVFENRITMQFKTIAAILLGVTATGALAGPVTQVRTHMAPSTSTQI